MDCCSEPSLSTLTIRENGLAWCPICGAEYRLEWTIEDGFHLVLVTVGIAEPAKLDGIRIATALHSTESAGSDPISLVIYNNGSSTIYVGGFEIEVPEAVAAETPLAERVEALEEALAPEG